MEEGKNNQADVLPPLPPSDAESLAKNHFDGFYKRHAREFWANSEIHSEEVKPFSKCIHEFEKTEDGILCKKCHFGLLGEGLLVKDGKLYIRGELVTF